MNWWTLPESFSTFGDDIDDIFGVITLITVAIFVIVQVALVYFLIRYRHRPDRKAYHIHGNLRAELIWTAVPFVIVIFIALSSAGVWHNARSPASIPRDAFEIAVEAKQFEWTVTYPGADDSLGTGDDFTARNQLHVPVGRPVVVRLTSADVIHSFFLPAMRVKQDAVPGMEQNVWFEVTAPGEYVLGCAELCGLGHYRMKGSMTAYAQDEFDRWYREQGGAALAAASDAAPGVAP